MAKVIIEYEAQAASLKAVTDTIINANKAIGDSAEVAAKEGADAYKSMGKSMAAAFSSQEVSKALNSNIANINKNRDALTKLTGESIKFGKAAATLGGQIKQNAAQTLQAKEALAKYQKSLTDTSKGTDATEKKTQSLKGRLRELKEQLSLLETAGQDGTEAFQKLAVEAGKLQDQISDTQERVKVLASDTFKFDAALGAVKGLAAGFAVAQGAAALFGGESEDLNKTIAKTQASIALLTGLQEIANLVTGQAPAKLAVLAAAQSVYNFVVGESTGKLKVFKLALASTGVGLLIIGLAALVANFDAVKDAISGTSATSKALSSTLEATKTALGGAIEQTTKVGNAFELAKKGVISKEEALLIYNDTLGATFGKTNDLNVAEANYIKKKDAYIASTIARAQANELLAQSAVLAAEAATASLSDQRGVAEKVVAFSNRANAAFVDLLTGGLTNVTETSKKINNEQAKTAQIRVKTEKEAQAEVLVNLFKSKTKEAELIEASAGIFSEAQQKINDELAAKRAEANEKALADQKKALEDQLAAREQLRNLENEAFISQLGEQEKILNESNNKILELEKTFRSAKFKVGSDEEIQAQKDLDTAIAQVKAQATSQILEIDKQTNEKLLTERLNAAKAGEDATLQVQLVALQNQQKLELEAADSLGKSKLEIETRYGLLIANVNKQISSARISTEINNIKTLELEEGSSLDRRIELINIEAEKRRTEAANSIKDEKERGSAIDLINAETQQAITAENEAEFQKRSDLVFQYANAVANVFSGINDLSKQATEQRVADITASGEAELNAINNSDALERDKVKQRAALEKRTQAAIAAEKNKQASRDKALAIFQATISTARAITEALPNIPLSILIGAAGAIQIAAIASQPIPKFEKGGEIGGKRHSEGGTMVEAEQGEYIVNRKQTSTHRRELNALNQSSDAFKKLIHDRYVRPALMNYMLGSRSKEMGVNVNATLNSKSMEAELKGLRKDLRNDKRQYNNSIDSRYSWQ